MYVSDTHSEVVRLLRAMPIPDHIGGGVCKQAADIIEEFTRECAARNAIDPVTRLQNLCDGLAESRRESPYDEESWQLADESNRKLQAEITRLRAELAEARVGEERYQCLLHNVGLINDLAKSWNPVTNGKLIDYLNLKVAAIVARTTKSSV